MYRPSVAGGILLTSPKYNLDNNNDNNNNDNNNDKQNNPTVLKLSLELFL